MSQLNQIRDILIHKRKISNFEAIDTRLTTRLGAHIFKLRATLTPGWEITTERLPNKDTVYHLVQVGSPAGEKTP